MSNKPLISNFELINNSCNSTFSLSVSLSLISSKKYLGSKAFENYLNGIGERGSVIHAWQGAFLAKELFSDGSVPEKLLKEIICLCVTVHHNHLDDGVAPDGATPYYDKF